MITDFDDIPEFPAILGPAKQIAYMVDDIDQAIAIAEAALRATPNS